MAVTNTLLRTLKIAEHFCRNAPLTGVGGDPTEPGMSIGDWVRNFILAPPFAWRWNRATTSFITLTDGTQDYSKSLPNFGWLERATTNDGKATSTSIRDLSVKLLLPEDASLAPPEHISARLDDNAGNITFRLAPAPDIAYTVTIAYQLASPTFVTVNDSWAPIPDYMSHLYSTGVLARAYEYFDDPRYAFTFQLFLRELVGSSEGLEESQKNVFLSDFLDNIRQQQAIQQNQFGRQGRAGY